MGSNPMNQRADIGKIPKDFNPPKILKNSFESNEPLMLITLGPGAMISYLNRLCYHIYVLDLILQVIVSYYVL